MSGSCRNSQVSSLVSDFEQKARQPKKRLPPVSIRFTAAERKELERRAGDQALSTYIRDHLFNEVSTPKRRRIRGGPSKHDQAIARALRRLGHCGLAAYLAGQIAAQEEGRLGLCASDEKELRAAYQELYAIRSDLTVALGLQAE